MQVAERQHVSGFAHLGPFFAQKVELLAEKAKMAVDFSCFRPLSDCKLPCRSNCSLHDFCMGEK